MGRTKIWRTEGRSVGGVGKELVNSFLFVTKDCFLVKRRKVRIRNGKGTRKRKNNGMGDGQVKRRVRCGNNRKSERGRKKSKLVIIIRSSWHYLPLLGRTLEA